MHKKETFCQFRIVLGRSEVHQFLEAPIVTREWRQGARTIVIPIKDIRAQTEEQ